MNIRWKGNRKKKGFDFCCSCMVFPHELTFNFFVAYIPFGSETWATPCLLYGVFLDIFDEVNSGQTNTEASSSPL